MPTEPPPSRWRFPWLDQAPPGGGFDDLIAEGADLAPGTVLAAYRHGLFPMPVDDPDRLGWWSPVRRGVLLPGALRVTRSLRQSARHYEVRVDTAFEEVMRGCADPRREGSWITQEFVEAYTELHRLGWAHSVETWAEGELVGGLYGLAIGGLFAGESMFHRARDASKVALLGLVARLPGDALIDTQWQTRHLATLGVVEIPRAEYLVRLRVALARPQML